MSDITRFLSGQVQALKPSGIRRFFDIVSEMEDAISLGVGEPDFVTPWGVRDAAIKSIQRGYTQYTSNSGLLELRERIAEYLNRRLGLSYCPKNQILVTIGASEAIDITFRAVLNPGDEVLVPEPSYVSYAPCISLCGGVPVPLRCRREELFKVTPESIEAAVTPRTKVLLLAYPNNPTGAIMEREFLEKLAPVILKHDLLVVSDEIYSELTYDGSHSSIAQLPDMQERTVLINGFSKAFAMTGWRVGYLAAPAELFAAILKIHQYIIMCACTMSQYAALNALEQGLSDNFSVVEEMREKYNMRRRFVVQALNEMGLDCFEPKGAFYVFPSVRSTGLDGESFAEALLRSQKVAVVPGNAFGESGTDFVRMSYASSMRNLDAAMERIARFVGRGQ